MNKESENMEIYGTIPVFAGGTVENGLSRNNLSRRRGLKGVDYEARNYRLDLDIRCLPFIEIEGSLYLCRSLQLGPIPSKMNLQTPRKLHFSMADRPNKHALESCKSLNFRFQIRN
jgi:hypothetical protein